MKNIRFFLMPTLIGWAAGFLACLMLHFERFWALTNGTPHQNITEFINSNLSIVAKGGYLFVVPSFLLATLPLSWISLKGLRGLSERVNRYTYICFIIAIGVIVTALIGTVGFDFEIVVMLFIPVIPYALAVGYFAEKWNPRLELSPNQSTDPAP